MTQNCILSFRFRDAFSVLTRVMIPA